MAWRKSPAELISRFDRALPPDPRIERRSMFGYPAAFVNGNLFAGLHQENVVLRLDADDRQRVKTEHGAGQLEPMPGRTMREYILVPAPIVADEQRLGEWLALGLAFVATLPPKAKKVKARRGARALPARHP